jgi:3D (Asp-Asp-Asp) domain-containing protein
LKFKHLILYILILSLGTAFGDNNKSIVVSENNITKTNILVKNIDENQSSNTQNEIHIKPKNKTIKTNINYDIIRLGDNKNKSNILDVTKFAKASLESYSSTYLVKNGDTIGAIARKFNVAQSEILSINPHISKGKLRAGKEIFMPVSQDIVDSISNEEHKIGHEDTLDEIAKKLKIKTSEFKKYNNSSISNKLTARETLIVPSPSNINKLKAKIKASDLENDSIIIENKSKQLRVTASAYTSHVNQTSASPFLTAWGHKLIPGQKTIAVSRDLISKYGLTNGSKVKIGGLDGEYVVRDKMNKRYTEHIDIYMGLDKAKALRWGRRSATISW